MILYFSSAIPYEKFNYCLDGGTITGGHQAQKFNNLIITGLAEHTSVCAVSNPPYTDEMPNEQTEADNTSYFISGGAKGQLKRKISNIIHMYRCAAKAHKSQKTDYIISDGINLGASAAAWLFGKLHRIPVVTIVTDIPEIMCSKMNIFYRLDAFLMKRYDGYILLTEAMNDIVNPKKRPYIIMEGSCSVVARPDDDVKRDDRNKKICMYSGSLHKNTGIELLVESFILADLPNAELHLYGAGDYVQDLKRIADEHENIKYFGALSNSEVVKKQMDADLLINPRPSDISFGAYSFPSKIMEYMASGTPVLTTKLPGIPEEYYKYVYIIDDESQKGFADILSRTLNKDQKELSTTGASARQFVIENKNNVFQAERILRFAELLKLKK